MTATTYALDARDALRRHLDGLDARLRRLEERARRPSLAVDLSGNPMLGAQTVRAAAIAPNAVGMRQRQPGHSDNLVDNPGAESGVLYPHDPSDSAGVGWAVQSTVVRSGAYAYQFRATGQSAAANLWCNGHRTDSDGHAGAAVGDEFVFSGWARHHSTAAANRVRLFVQFRDSASAILATTYSDTTPTAADGAGVTAWALLSASATAPASTSYVVFGVQVMDDGNTTACYADDLYARRRVTDVVLADNAVVTRVITNAAVTDAKIVTVVADKIVTGTLQSSVVTVGSGGVIRAGRTSTPFHYLLIDSGGIEFYESGSAAFTGGTKTVDLDVTAGTASFSGTVTAGTIRSAASGKRLEITSVGNDKLSLYTGDAEETAAGSLTVAASAGVYGVVTLNSPAFGSQDVASVSCRSETDDGATVAKVLIAPGGATLTIEPKGTHILMRTDVVALKLLNGVTEEVLVRDEADSVYLPIRASSFPVGSKAAYKTGITQPAGGSLARLMALPVRSWRFTSGDPSLHLSPTYEDAKAHAPEIVSEPDGLDPRDWLGLVTLAVQELVGRLPQVRV